MVLVAGKDRYINIFSFCNIFVAIWLNFNFIVFYFYLKVAKQKALAFAFDFSSENFRFMSHHSVIVGVIIIQIDLIEIWGLKRKPTYKIDLVKQMKRGKNNSLVKWFILIKLVIVKLTFVKVVIIQITGLLYGWLSQIVINIEGRFTFHSVHFNNKYAKFLILKQIYFPVLQKFIGLAFLDRVIKIDLRFRIGWNLLASYFCITSRIWIFFSLMSVVKFFITSSIIYLKV